MTFKEFLTILYHKKGLIFWTTLLAAFLAFDAMIILPAKYKASSAVLVVQKQTAGQDVYTISKSAQTLSNVLKEGIYSDSFFEKVINSPYQVEASDFPSKIKDRKKEWEKTVKVSIVRDLGILDIDVYFKDKEKTENINRAILAVLKENHQFYHGAGSAVEIRVLDYPMVSEKRDMTNVYLGTLSGALMGLILAMGLALKRARA